MTRSLILVAGLLFARAGMLYATAPKLYSQPAYESPVRGDPDDLLLLPGDGVSSSDRVVYLRLRDTTLIVNPPALRAVPAAPTAEIGFADVVSTANVPNSLAIRLPAEISTDESYALWVVNSQGEWSNGVRINDSRPLWISPDIVYATEPMANLPRALKVVGRNLQPTTHGQTQVRLSGPRIYTLKAEPSSRSLARHVARVALPPSMAPGQYGVQVSRDGVNWVGLMSEPASAARVLTVLPDAPALPVVNVRDYDCEPDDDTSCVVGAVTAAGDTRKFPIGATIAFEARTYRLHDPGTWSSSNESSKHVDFEGIWIPKGVQLRGQGAGLTLVERGKGWVTTRFARDGRSVPIVSLFNLQGDNTVQGFTFSDENVYTSTAGGSSAALSLGIDAHYARNIALRDPRLSHVIISRNEFRTPFVAILGQGLPLDHLFITYNTVGAYENGLYINRSGNTDAGNPFDMTDSVVAYNVFHPSSHSAVIASQLGGGTRLDFSDNTADGTSTRYFYDRADTKGFRAGFFWNLSANSELKLISNNTVLCAGDKPGDGEAIVFDGADERAYGGFERAAPLVSATSSPGGRSSTITVDSKPLLVGPLGFVSQWLQVVQGPGLGQLRKITSYKTDEHTATFTVAPAFDVLPGAASAVTVGLQNWQSYILDNVVDQSTGTCVNGPKSAATAGSISFYAQTADSVIAGNRQLSATGISLTHQYILQPGQPAFLMLQSANEVRDNQIDRAPAFGGLLGVAGIRIFFVATPEPGAQPAPPVLDFGLTIAGNRLNEAADALGGITLEDGGPVGFLNARGGCAAVWKLAAAPLIFHNDLRNSRGIDISGRQLPQHPATCRGSVRDSVVWNATLYGNSCGDVAGALFDGGTGTRAVCPAPGAHSCECPLP